MRQPRPENQLTLEEKQEVRAALDNGRLVSALRKIFNEEAEYWSRLADAQTEMADPSTAMIVQFSARKSQARRWEKTVREGVGA